MRARYIVRYILSRILINAAAKLQQDGYSKAGA